MNRITLVLVLALAAAGCTSSPSLVGEAPGVSLAVSADPGDGDLQEATLQCGETGATGTGYLADPNAAREACDVVDTNKQRLVDGAPDDQVCTQQYGGPDVATVTGTLDGASVDTTFQRNDGCAISDWSTFQPLLPAPGNLLGISGG